jgi:eukaryotic-like serine/threonine-protein kinase
MGRTGRRLANRYRLIEKLGTGGMSVVWRGHDEVLGREVAVKILSPRLAGDDAFRDRMRQEALAAARLSHPHITGIFDFGESPLSEELTVPYVVMELNDGESVSARLRRDGPLPWPDAVTITAEVASALAAAHARGVVHRDVTPANVMLTRTGAKVVDFGISALVGQRDAAPDGSLLGTPAYLAPERLTGGQVLPAADVYALGLLLYRLLTTRLPWPAETTTEALRAHLYADPEPLPAGIPPAVSEMCSRCLAKDPADRPTATEMANRLGALTGLPAVAHKPVLPPLVRRNARLRAVLRVAKALRVGRAKALGGGLFQGGQLTHDLLGGWRRLPAALATLMLVGVVGVTWAATREPDAVGPAQAAAAGAGSAAGVRHSAECKVRYRVEEDTGDDFAARLTVVNTGERTVGDWRMEFAYPGTQRLTEPTRSRRRVARWWSAAGPTWGPGGRSRSTCAARTAAPTRCRCPSGWTGRSARPRCSARPRSRSWSGPRSARRRRRASRPRPPSRKRRTDPRSRRVRPR